VNVAIRAIGMLPGVHLLVVGGPSGPDGEAEFDRLGALGDEVAPGRVEFRDPISHDLVADVYRAADVVAVPSRSESFGLVAAEAQAAGTPVVAARVGGLAYTVSDGVSGTLVTGDDPTEWAAAFAAVLDDPAQAARLSAGAVAHAKEFSWEATADRLLELYRGMAS